MRHTISVLVENKFGVLARVAGMISGRGFNIDSLNVAPTHDASLSRITIVLKGDDSALDLCTKQLRKLVNVVEVMDFKDGHQTIARELILVKVKADAKSRPEILQIKEVFRAKIANLAQDSLIIELTGDEDKVAAFLALLEPFGILEISRTGTLALKR
jgi:acetolactate synthase-1/3 small subunit